MNFKKFQLLACGIAVCAFVSCNSDNNNTENVEDTAANTEEMAENIDEQQPENSVVAVENLTTSDLNALMEAAKNGDKEAIAQLNEWQSYYQTLTDEQKTAFEEAFNSYEELVSTGTYQDFLLELEQGKEIIGEAADLVRAAGGEVSAQAEAQAQEAFDNATEQINEELNNALDKIKI